MQGSLMILRDTT